MSSDLFGCDPAPRSFAVTMFDDFAATARREASLSLEELAELVRTTSAPTKEALPWLKLARFGPLRNPSSNSGSLRWNGNVLRISGVVADYDGELITPQEAAERLDKAGVAGLIYTSPSHMLNEHGPRWRVVCPFRAELPQDDHYHMIARLNGLFDGELASESFTLSQCYYFGRVGDNPAHEVIICEGTATLDLCDELDHSAVGKFNGYDRQRAAGADPQAPIEDIHAALALIPNPIPSWGPHPSWVEWNNLGMAIWRASGGSAEGFEAFNEWSKKSPKYDAEETEFRWRHYSQSPPDQIGFGSLVHSSPGGSRQRSDPMSRRRSRCGKISVSLIAQGRKFRSGYGSLRTGSRLLNMSHSTVSPVLVKPIFYCNY